MNFTVVPRTSNSKLAAECPAAPQQAGPCGVSSVHIGGDAELVLSSGVVAQERLRGHFYTMHPETNQFRMGYTGEDAFVFDVASKLNKHYQHLEVAFPVTPKELTKNEDEILNHGANGSPLFSKSAVHKVSSALELMGAKLHDKHIFKLKSVKASKVTVGKKEQQPFSVRYQAEYFGHPYHTDLGFTLPQLANARTSKYKTVSGKGLCVNSDLLYVGYKYTEASARRKCDSLPSCVSFMFSKDPQDVPGSAWFCAKAMSPNKELSAQYPKWLIATRESTQVHLLHRKDTDDFVRIGLSETLPALLRKQFRRHGGLYGFQFKPKLVKRHGEMWLEMQVKPTKRGYKMVQKQLRKATLQAVRHLTLNSARKPNPEAELMSQHRMKHVLTVHGAMKEKLKELKEHTFTNAARIKQQLRRALKDSKDGQVHEDGKEILSLMKLHSIMPDTLTHAEYLKKLKKDEAVSAVREKELSDLVNKLHVEADAAVAKAVVPMRRAAKFLAARHPRLKKIVIEPLYMQCVYEPSKCDESKLASPKIKVCFTDIGCSDYRKFPGMMGFLDLISHQAANQMAFFMTKVAKWRTQVFRFPEFARLDPTIYNIADKRVVHRNVQVTSVGPLIIGARRLVFPVGLRKGKVRKIAAKPKGKRPAMHHSARANLRHMANKMMSGVHGAAKTSMQMGLQHELAKMKGKTKGKPRKD